MIINPPINLINWKLENYKDTFSDLQTLREDPRETTEIAKSLISLKTDLGQRRFELMWSRLVHNETSLRKALKISLKAVAVLIYSDKALNI